MPGEKGDVSGDVDVLNAKLIEDPGKSNRQFIELASVSRCA